MSAPRCYGRRGYRHHPIHMKCRGRYLYKRIYQCPRCGRVTFR